MPAPDDSLAGKVVLLRTQTICSTTDQILALQKFKPAAMLLYDEETPFKSVKLEDPLEFVKIPVGILSPREGHRLSTLVQPFSTVVKGKLTFNQTPMVYVSLDTIIDGSFSNDQVNDILKQVYAFLETAPVGVEKLSTVALLDAEVVNYNEIPDDDPSTCVDDYCTN